MSLSLLLLLVNLSLCALSLRVRRSNEPQAELLCEDTRLCFALHNTAKSR